MLEREKQYPSVMNPDVYGNCKSCRGTLHLFHLALRVEPPHEFLGLERLGSAYEQV